MPLLSTTRRTTTLSPPLPVANKVLAQNGVTLRRGQFSLWAAAPGVGKSLMLTNLAIRTPVPALFLSADSDEWTVKTRACSILTGQKLTDVEKHLNSESEAWDGYYADALRQADHVDWCFRTDIDLDFIALRVLAHAELRGDYPQLVVIDNLGNSVTDQDNEYAELRGICRELQAIARTSNVHVAALHHVKGAKEDGWKPVGMGDLLGNLGKIPEQVFGLNRQAENVINLTVAKNRGGKSGMHIQLGIDYTTATVGGY